MKWYKLTAVLLLFLVACDTSEPSPTPPATEIAEITDDIATPAGDTQPTFAPTFLPPTATAIPSATPTTTPTVTPRPTSTPFPTTAPAGAGTPHCGHLLPILPASIEPAITEFNTHVSLEDVPENVQPAIEQIVENPGRVGLVAYQIGQEGNGIYHNPDTPMPLASVVKILPLVAYAQAVFNGELNPATPVPLRELERYYLPNSDLGAHELAIEELQAEGRVNNSSILLEDIPRMMIQYSSNAASDYLHDLLGQERIEQVALDYELNKHTAPCPFIGQFLAMANRQQLLRYMADPNLYAIDVIALSEQFSTDSDFREDSAWQRGRGTGRPSIENQRLFSENLNAQASPRDYANLMALIATNEAGPWTMNVTIRRYLEWPTFFPDNQAGMAWLGYKGGSLPGVLTVAYYAQPWWTTEPIVITLFYRNLPQATHNTWQRALPHDELARWLLSDPEALPLVRDLLTP